MRLPRLLIAGLLSNAAAVSSASAHPGSGIVVDRAGNVYFVVAGTNAIMKLGPDGRASTFVNDERLRLPHHLVLGRDGALYAASDHDGRVWSVGIDGALREYFNSNRAAAPANQPVHIGAYGDPFTIDSAGNIYALATAGASAIVRIAPDGRVTPVAIDARFGQLHFGSMAWGADRSLYLTDETRVWRIANDSATAIRPRGVDLSLAAGVVVDSAGNVYVADYAAGRIVRFGPDGAVNTPRETARLRIRNPVGVTLAGGALYVLASPPGGVSVVRVRDGRSMRLYSKRSAQFYSQWVFVGLLVTLLTLLAIRVYQRVRGSRNASPATPAK